MARIWFSTKMNLDLKSRHGRKVMRRLPVSSALAISLLCFSTPVMAAPQETNQTPPAPAIPASTYPDSPDGVKKFVGDIFAAMESGDNEKASALLSSLSIPDHTAWFVKMFVPEEAPRLDAKYADVLPDEASKIRGLFEYALVRGGRTEVEASVVGYPVAGPLGRAIAEAMVQPFSIYSVTAGDPNAKSLTLIGDFVYVDGGFRFIDTNVFQALSTAPPMRVQVGGIVEAGRLIHSIPPTYPPDAKAQHIEGDVVLHAIIGKDGTIKELTRVTGDPLLISSAIDAVRQWQYRPYLLNGAPVEVDTTITFHFRL
jgi:TonB family protein